MAGEQIDIERVKQARIDKGLSIMEVSEALGYKSYVAYYRKEEGMRKFSTNDVVKLSTLLGLELKDIFLSNKFPQR